MKVEEYVRIIMEDDTDKILRETPTVYEETQIIREYEFEDGAVVAYEWKAASLGEFNHRFTLLREPTSNRGKLTLGEITTIDY